MYPHPHARVCVGAGVCMCGMVMVLKSGAQGEGGRNRFLALAATWNISSETMLSDNCKYDPQNEEKVKGKHQNIEYAVRHVNPKIQT